jgi:S1-C subfamily serine protease
MHRRWPAALAVTLWGLLAARGSGGAPCELPLSEIYARVTPAIVSIHATKINKARPDRRFETIVGSGFLVESDGLALTNAHVVDGAASITTALSSGERVPTRIIGLDTALDVALVKLQATGPQPTVRFGDSSSTKVGDEVLTIGSPVGLERTMTRGIVSAVNRVLPYVNADEPMLQTDAPINPGNSGGPLLDRCATVIGINTLFSEEAHNVGFAIPINLVKAAMRSLRESGRVVRPWLGVQGRTMDPSLAAILKLPVTAGYLVEVVEDGGPAEQAGLRGGNLAVSVQGDEFLLGGDTITAINGIPVRSQNDLQARVKILRPGQRVKLSVFRDGSTRDVSLLVAERPRLPYDLAEE